MARVWCSNDKAQHWWYVNLQYLYVVSSVIRVFIPIPIPYYLLPCIISMLPKFISFIPIIIC